jgi:hypothetical protein
MKKTNIFLQLVVASFISLQAFAQVPSYVPTNGLVGYWPFSGNANDASGNGNNGTVNGATLTSDRTGQLNAAYLFNSNSISFSNSNFAAFGINSFTSSIWVKFTALSDAKSFVRYGNCGNSSGWGMRHANGSIGILEYSANVVNLNQVGSQLSYNDGLWHHCVFIRDVGTNQIRLYINGVLIATSSFAGGTTNNILPDQPFFFGTCNGFESFIGTLDDIGIWNRALTQQEITALYEGCNLNPSISNTTVSPNQNASFSTAFLSGVSYQWQTNPDNFGWLNIPSNASYSGVNTNTLTVNNVQLGNHNQQFRVKLSAGLCLDTSNVSILSLADTCITSITETETIYDTITTINTVTVYDTITTTNFISVTDTLIINTTLGVAPNQQENTIKVYPNPANSHISIHTGNFALMAGYRIKIQNALAQEVYNEAITQQEYFIDLSTWSGNGTYFVHIIDNQGITVDVRKIILQ